MKLPRWIFATLLALLLAGIGPSAWAAESTGERIGLKAVRGLENTVFGFVTELPKTVYYQSKAHGLPYGTTVGFVQGLAVGLTRTTVGVYELATFPVPVPSNYRPILSPQFSLDPEETGMAQ